MGSEYFIGAEFQYDVDIEMVLKMPTKLNNIPVLEGLVDFYFAHQLLLGPWLH